MKPLLIGLSGKAGSGKSTVGAYLTDNHGYFPFAFANALKETVGMAFGFSDDQLYGSLKEVVDERFGRSPRWCLQYLGTEVLRTIWPEIWIWHLRREIMDFLSTNGQHPIVVTDVRFKDEAEALKRLGRKIQLLGGGAVVLIRIDRPGAAAREGMTDHVSETDLDGWDGWDYVIKNIGGKDDLIDLVDLVLFNGQEARRAELAKAAR